MSKSFLTGINLNKNQITNVVIDNESSDFGSPSTGQLWFNTTTGLMKWYNGSAVIDPLNRTNHSGTQTASTISNLASTVQAYSLSSFAAPTASVSAGGFTITNLGTPVNSTDASTKGYVDSAIAGLSWKEAVACATTGNITLSGEQTIDGVTTSSSRVLVKNQSTPSQNGIYISGTGAWTRSTDATSSTQFNGLSVYVQGGSTWVDTGWVCSAVNPTVGTTSIAFVQFSGSASYTAGTGLTLSGNTFSISSGAITNTLLANSSITVTAGSGLSGGGAVTLGGSVTLTNAGVTSAVAGTGISVSGATGAVTIANTGVTSISAGSGITVSGTTGAITISASGTGTVSKYATTIGDGSSTSFTVTHNLGSLDVAFELYLVSGGASVVADTTHASINTLTVGFATAPSANSIRVVVIG